MNQTSTSLILKNLTNKMKELSHIRGDAQLLGRWAHSFVETCLGFNQSRDYRSYYSDIGSNWRPTLVLAREEGNFCTMEVGAPSVKRHKGIAFALLFTGEEWRLYDLQAPDGPSIMAVCDMRSYIKAELTERLVIELEKDLAAFHETAYQSKVWDELVIETRKCTRDSMTGIMLSPDVLQLIQDRLGLVNKEPPCHNMLRHKIVDMLEAQTPVTAKHKGKRSDQVA